MRVEVLEERALVVIGDEDVLDPVRVVAPPPMVETTTWPSTLVVVMTVPSGSEEEDAPSSSEVVGADVVAGVLEGVLLSSTGVEDSSVGVVEVSPGASPEVEPCGTGVGKEGEGSADVSWESEGCGESEDSEGSGDPEVSEGSGAPDVSEGSGESEDSEGPGASDVSEGSADVVAVSLL